MLVDSQINNKPLPGLPSQCNPSYMDDFDIDYPLIFPGETSSARKYICQTQLGIKSPIQSLLTSQPIFTALALNRAGLGHDPYGWQEWDAEMQSKENRKANAENSKVDVETVKENVRFCLLRKRRSMRSQARIREEERRQGISGSGEGSEDGGWNELDDTKQIA
ncbi:hypothetical protein EK21DRAFT_110897 [Setomelanomma holmii]|uniref:Uncharacterized protein n=1 Tax=Setomelanomma holmii TaxID=210430 RepID=A0A9P4HCG1_9PLEO|nr:hypothetical protein EK21DRAFT_110897 [Setomelanomma holmii]